MTKLPSLPRPPLQTLRFLAPQGAPGYSFSLASGRLRAWRLAGNRFDVAGGKDTGRRRHAQVSIDKQPIVGGSLVLVDALMLLRKFIPEWRREQAERGQAATEALENIQTLDKAQPRLLYSALTGPQRRFDVSWGPGGAMATALIKKQIFVVAGNGLSGWICVVHPAIVKDQQLLPVLKQACDLRSNSPVVRLREKRWTVA